MLILGTLGGLISLVRNQDIILLLPVTVYFIFKIDKGFLHPWMERLNRMVLFWGSVFLVMSIQLFMTLNLYGQLGSPYILGGEKLLWFRPDFIRVLFSFGNGLFTFAPILVVAVLGLVWVALQIIKKGQMASLSNLKIKNKRLYKHFAIIALASFLLQLYVVGSWGREIIGGPYGSRMFISVLPHLSLGLALFFEKYTLKGTGKNYRRSVLFIALGLGLLIINNLLQTAIMLIRF